MIEKTEITQVLNGLGNSEKVGSADRLLPLVYSELRDLAGRYFQGERQDHTLQPTALVHEAYLKLVDIDRIEWRGRTHFFAMGAKTMRRILVDHARAKLSEKRGGERRRISLEEGMALSRENSADVLAVEDALLELERRDPRAAEVTERKFFGGMTEVEIAESLGVSRRTVQNDWRVAKAWLRKYLSSRLDD